MKVTNQKPIVLSPIYNDTIANTFDPIGCMEDIIAKPMFTPLVAGNSVSIKANNQTLSSADITNHMLACCQDAANPTEEAFMKDLFQQTLISYNNNTTIGANEIFVIQSAAAEKMPEPTDKIIYTPSADIIPSARKFIGGQCSYDTFFASLAFYARPDTLGFYFCNEIAFDDFKTWLAQQMTMLGNVLPPDTTKLMTDFQTLKLSDLTESLQLRAKDDDNNDPYSFARTIVSQLMIYTNTVSNAEFGVLPFSVTELLCPKTIVFVNVERHAKATAREIAEEWKLIKNSISTKPNVISMKKLSRLTAASRNLKKIASAAVTAANNTNSATCKAAVFRFKETRPTTVDIIKLIKKVMNKMSFVNKSMNVYKQSKVSYARPNRRDPDDYNKPGKMVSTKYRPDIHLYIDTSGSISERDYEDAVKACITMAQKMNINLYFNSFSHVLSQTTRLHLQNKSKAQIYREFQKVDKVEGSTDYAQIWKFINSNKKRTRELSIIISDFEFTAPREYIKHPKNLYYIPCTTINYDNIKYWAEQFAKSMVHNDPQIRKHILF